MRGQTTVAVADSEERAQTACRYCFAPAVTPLMIESGDELKFPVYVDVCEHHLAQLSREQPESVDRLRRKHARNVPQLSIFDLPELASSSAILGG